MVGAIAVGALLLFAAGEFFAWFVSDSGRLTVWRHLHLGSRAHAVRIVGNRIEQGLEKAGVPKSAVASEPLEGNGPSLHWRVTLPREAAPMLVNHLITRAVEDGGAEVLSGREHVVKDGAFVVTLEVGVPGRPTHVVDLVRARETAEDAVPPAPRLAVLLYASPEDDSLLVATCGRDEVFGVGAAARARRSARRTSITARSSCSCRWSPRTIRA